MNPLIYVGQFDVPEQRGGTERLKWIAKSTVCLLEFTHHAMEPAFFVTLWLATVVLGLTGAELAKVLSRFWNYILE